MTTEALALPSPTSIRLWQRLMAGRAGPVVVILLVLLAVWYSATIWLNAPFARQIAPDPASLTGPALVAATMSLDRPVLPAPHQVAVEFWRSVATIRPSSPRSLLYHAWVTLASTLSAITILLVAARAVNIL